MGRGDSPTTDAFRHDIGVDVAPAAKPLLASLDREVARVVEAERAAVRIPELDGRSRPFVRRALIGAAVGAVAGGVVGYQVDNARHEGTGAGGYTKRGALLGAAVGVGIGALTAIIR